MRSWSSTRPCGSQRMSDTVWYSTYWVVNSCKIARFPSPLHQKLTLPFWLGMETGRTWKMCIDSAQMWGYLKRSWLFGRSGLDCFAMAWVVWVLHIASHCFTTRRCYNRFKTSLERCMKCTMGFWPIMACPRSSFGNKCNTCIYIYIVLSLKGAYAYTIIVRIGFVCMSWDIYIYRYVSIYIYIYLRICIRTVQNKRSRVHVSTYPMHPLSVMGHTRWICSRHLFDIRSWKGSIFCTCYEC